jgi:hypothetical protein
MFLDSSNMKARVVSAKDVSTAVSEHLLSVTKMASSLVFECLD